jgi:PAS domain S-box-containing protein
VERYELLPPEAASAARARALVRHTLAAVGVDPTGADGWGEAAELAVSEVVTNALVHGGTPIGVRVRAGAAGLRVEVSDGNPHHPSVREYATLAGTGRGLTLLEESVDRWGVEQVPEDGKTVWFEILAAGRASYDDPDGEDEAVDPGRPPALEALVELRNVPLLMHAAWQEHASALLRDFLLVQLDEDPEAIERHAQASDALNVLFEQIPAPDLGEDPEVLMATAVEPGVSLPVARLAVPLRSVPHFQELDVLLASAIAAATAGHLLVPPTQPEVQEMRAWLCDQVRGQAVDGRSPEAWEARTDPREPVDHVEFADWDPDEVRGSDRSLVATDERSVVVAASPSAVAFLGYADASELVGRRVIAIIPPRFRQAHIAGTTLHLVNGRSPLLGVRVRVPVLHADGTESEAHLRIEAHLRSSGRRLYLGELTPAGAA